MYLNPAQFVAVHNPQGVISWANSIGYNISGDANTLYQWLEERYTENPTATALKIRELHPHMLILKDAIGEKEKQAPKQIVIKLASRTKTVRNFTEVTDGDGYAQQVTDLVNTGYEEGVNAVNTFANNNNKDHTNEMLKLAGAFIAGAIVVKLFSK